MATPRSLFTFASNVRIKLGVLKGGLTRHVRLIL